ncbi:calcium/calmodulin-dependent 3',5'-cyclic nucleotide phosphodiesterase 1A isoform X1 [Octopus sinensis]|uniref:Phosphodiesterase n=1 Tax=Octopus sinensis TaxID=2607531 RepID=A0A7E6FA70_9MOLL|nr:calcium/calmodulin-dependent 3',5'-cyclic nucleotide phosphodiesterase 1A isoform X1 [Octopus sinensis]
MDECNTPSHVVHEHRHIKKCKSATFTLDGTSYTIAAQVPGEELEQTKYIEVANSPDKTKDDSSIGSKNGQVSRTGSLTVLRQNNSRKLVSSSSRTSSTVSIDSDSYASGELGFEKMPAADAPEASHYCSMRMRQIYDRVFKDDILKEDLLKNLAYAADVLEAVHIDETKSSESCANVDPTCSSQDSALLSLQSASVPHQSGLSTKKTSWKHPVPVNNRRLCDEDDELSEVEPDAVPTEVRDWLALTFTRSMNNIKRKGEEKPRFRSVANVIRAGIMVDRLFHRIYRRMSGSVGLHIPQNVLTVLKNLDDWSFDVFATNEDSHALKYVGYELLQKYDLLNKFKINTSALDAFLTCMEAGYTKYKNPYHNLLHAADVAHTVHYILSSSKLTNWLTDLEIFATIIAALVHDYEHTGTTNNFHINTGSEVALLYNDKAVLENHHVSAAFKLLKLDEYNILTGLSKEEYREFRSLLIDMVLATDMSFHFQQIKNMKSMLTLTEGIEKSKALSLVLHCADISHPAKEWFMHKKWTDLLLEEFFRQGDREKELGLPFSPLCDRKTTLVAESQIGFIEFIVDPSFTVMGDVLQKIIYQVNQSIYACTPAKVDEVISEEVFERADSGSPRLENISNNSRPSAKQSSGHEVKRPWKPILEVNKAKWIEIAAQDAAERALKSSLRASSEQLDADRPESASEKTKTPPDSENVSQKDGDSQSNDKAAPTVSQKEELC